MKKIILLAVLVLLGIKEADAQIAIIANKSVRVDSISKSDLEMIYTLQTQKWPDGSKIYPINIKEKSELKSDFFECLGKTTSELKKLWMRLLLTGEARAPRAVKTQKEVISSVANTAGAIGYIDIEHVTPDIKVILVCR